MSRSPVERWVAQESARLQEVVEEACEQALQGGEHGVLVLVRRGIPFSAAPDASVPYGHIHYRPERAQL